MVAKAIVQAHHTHKLLHYKTADDAAISFLPAACASYSTTRVVALKDPCDGRPKNVTHHGRLKKCQRPANKQPLRQPDRVWSRAQVERLWPHVSAGNDRPLPVEGTEETLDVPQPVSGPAVLCERPSWLPDRDDSFESEPEACSLQEE